MWWVLGWAVLWAGALSAEEEASPLFRDLSVVKEIDAELKDHLPLFYNSSLFGGYFAMPSARMEKTGMAAIGGAIETPYTVYGLNFQPFSRVELSLNYRVYNGVIEQNFGKEGFGDDAERIGNVKFGILTPEDGFPLIPELSFGIEDFIGTKRFNATYLVATKQWLRAHLECSLGWGWGRLHGPFGALSWTPWRRSHIPVIKDLSFIAEYDATNYKKHPHEHPDGRTVHSRVNGGLSLLAWDVLQLSVNSLRGVAIAGSASLRYPIGTSKGLFPKIDDPSPYTSPVDQEPLGLIRSERDFSQELAYAFGDQGLDLYTASLEYDLQARRVLYLTLVNNRYREEAIVRERIQRVLAALLPSDISLCIVTIEADAFPTESYTFRNEDLQRWRQGQISDFEIATLSPMQEAVLAPSPYDAPRIFERHKPIWTFTIRPRLLTFFGTSSGKVKYNFGALASPEGYLFNQVYYKFQASYSIKSSLQGLSGADRLNPSRELIVRSDTLRYFQTNSFSIEQAWLQRSWNLSRGIFYRLACGYFEPAYAGGATELLYYPVNSRWAVGLEAAGVFKRHYHGIKTRRSTWKLEGNHYTTVPFVGIQYFLDLYYDLKPLQIDFLVTAGQFLARDKGARLDVGRYFHNGMRFSLWCTWTNGHDKVNGHTYFDKGFAFMIPLDFFLKKSSRNYIGYAMSAWLRDVGAQADTGKKLYWTLRKERD